MQVDHRAVHAGPGQERGRAGVPQTHGRRAGITQLHRDAVAFPAPSQATGEHFRVRGRQDQLAEVDQDHAFENLVVVLACSCQGVLDEGDVPQGVKARVHGRNHFGVTGALARGARESQLVGRGPGVASVDREPTQAGMDVRFLSIVRVRLDDRGRFKQMDAGGLVVSGDESHRRVAEEQVRAAARGEVGSRKERLHVGQHLGDRATQPQEGEERNDEV